MTTIETPQLFAHEWYEPSAEIVAPALLGHFLLRRLNNKWVGGPIVETEAYLQNDPACHAAKGPTPRTEAMFEEAGRAYVYLIYGRYHCFNVVCLPPGSAEAVLVRAVEPVFGIEEMLANRPVDHLAHLASGPSKFCTAASINLEQDRADLCSLDSDVVIAVNPRREEYVQEFGPVIVTTRIGLNQAKEAPLRWYLEGSAHVSWRPKQKAPGPAP